jgi:uncharacterized protein
MTEGRLGIFRIVGRDRDDHGRAMVDCAAMLTVISLVFLFAGAIKGVVGMGLPTIAMGLLSLITPPADAATILILPSFVTNVWQSAAGPSLAALVRRLWPMLAASALGTAAGAWLFGAVNNAAAVAALGGALACYALLGLTPLRLRVAPQAESWLGPLAGGATGILAALTGVFVVPAVAYLQALELERDDLVQAVGLSALVSTLALAAVLARNGQFHLQNAGTSVLALLIAFAGMMLGQRMRSRIPAKTFRLCFLLGLLALGAHLLVRSTI